VGCAGAGAGLPVAGLLLAGAAGRLVLAGAVLSPVAGSSPGWLLAAGSPAVRVQVSGMPGLPPLVRVTVPAVSRSVRASRAAAWPIPMASAMTAVVAPPGWAASAA